MIFTNTDKALMMRAARHLATQAKTLEGNCGPNWARDKDAKVAKRDYDRLLRDERDLRELAKRLEKAAAAASAGAAAKTPRAALSSDGLELGGKFGPDLPPMDDGSGRGTAISL